RGARATRAPAADLDSPRRPAGGPAPPAPTAASASPAAGRPTDGARPLSERLHEQERTAIVAAIDGAQGNIAHAARALGINRSTLYYRMRKHGLEHLLPMKETPGTLGTAGAPVGTSDPTGAPRPPQSE